MANIGSHTSTSRREKEPLAGFLAPKDLLDTFLAETGTPPESDPEQVAGIRQNRFPTAGSGAHSAPLRVLVGFSGGADSTALLDRLSRTPGYSVAAAHVNHGIRGGEAIRDREFCREFCRDRGIPFFCLDANVPAMRRQGESLETSARRVRYGYFAAVMKEQNYPLLAVAHNADDNLETVLFRLCRGTGLRGLCGIPPVRAFGDGYLVRPLLCVSREEILRYLEERNLSYVTDSTNEETDAARNRLRLTVIPALRAATGDPVAGVTRMTRLLAADSRYLETEATRLFSADGDARTPGSGQRQNRNMVGARNSDSGQGRNGDTGIPGTTACRSHRTAANDFPEALSSVHSCPSAADDAGEPEFTSNSAPMHDGGGFPSCTETTCRDSGGYSAPSVKKTVGLPEESPGCRFQGATGFPAPEQSARPLRLSRAVLIGAADPLASRAIARLMEAAGGDPSAVHVEALLAFLHSGTAHGSFPVPGNKNAVITVTYDDVSVTAAPTAKKSSVIQNGTANGKASPAAGSTHSGTSNHAAFPAPDKPGFTAGTPVSLQSAAETASTAAGGLMQNTPLPGKAIRIRDGETCRFGKFTVERKTVPYPADFMLFPSLRSDPQGAADSEVPLPSRSTPQAGTPAKNGGRNAPKIYNSLLRCAVDTDKINKEVFLRVRQPGDRILTRGMHKEVRRLFSEARIPPGERDSYPRLCDGDGILAIPGIVVRDGMEVREKSGVRSEDSPRGNCAVYGSSRICGESGISCDPGVHGDGNSGGNSGGNSAVSGNCNVRNTPIADESRGENPSASCGTVTVFTFISGLPGTLSGKGSESNNL